MQVCVCVCNNVLLPDKWYESMSFQTPEMARYVKQSIRDEVEQKEFIDKKLIPNT